MSVLTYTFGNRKRRKRKSYFVTRILPSLSGVIASRKRIEGQYQKGEPL